MNQKMKIVIIASILVSQLLAGCGVIQVAEEMANNAPPAKPPKVIEYGKLHAWPSDSNYYSGGYSFILNIQHGLYNKMTLSENGVDIPYFDGNDPGNDKHTVYLSNDLKHDFNALWTQTKFTVMPATTATPVEGSTHSYIFTEESINPKYKGTSDQVAKLEFKIVVVTKPCSIVMFNIPQSVTSGTSAKISWRVNDCKKVELLENESVIYQETANGFAGSIEGSKSIVIQLNTNFKLRVTNATGKSTEVTSKLLATAPPPCPGNNNGGQPLYFTFCATCPGGNLGDYLYEQTVLACDQNSALQVVQGNFSNCQVKPGYCPRP